jgi:GT2 family glycosyltransferase
MTSANFDIIMPTYGRSDLLRTTLDTFLGVALPQELGRIWVVENGPPAGAQAICEALFNRLPLGYLYSHAQGLAAARNTGIKASSATFLLFLDDDVRPLAGALDAYVDAFRRYGDRAFYGGPLVPEYADTPPPAWLAEFLPLSAKGFSLGQDERTVSEDLYFLGGNMALPRGAFQEVPLFEGPCATGTSGGGLGEEARLQRRLVQHGYRGVYVPQAGVRHYVPGERCNTAFVRHRQWRSGYGIGQMEAAENRGELLVAGAPLRHWGALAVALARLAFFVHPFRLRKQKFWDLLKVSSCLGRIVGFRSARGQG